MYQKLKARVNLVVVLAVVLVLVIAVGNTMTHMIGIL